MNGSFFSVVRNWKGGFVGRNKNSSNILESRGNLELSQAIRLKEVDWQIHFSITSDINKNGSCCLTFIWVI